MDQDEIPLARVVAEAPRSLEYGRPDSVYVSTDPLPELPQRGRGWRLGELLTVVAILMILFAILLPELSTTRRAAAITACASALKQVTMAALNYAQDHGGTFPDSHSLLTKPIYYLSPDCMFCVLADKRSAVVGSRGSFIYCGGGLTTQSSPRSVVAYEHPANHPKENRVNIAYLDGSVRLTDIPQAKKVIAELQAGHNPPREQMLKGTAN